MSVSIEDYALIGDCQTAALVSREGSIDWLCLPRFDSSACFAALLGDRDNGRWLIRPKGDVQSISRRYRDGTLILETEMRTADGAIRLIDFMPPRTSEPDLVRIVEGIEGEVPVELDLEIRFGYGRYVPWVQRWDHRLSAVGGADALVLTSEAELRGEDWTTVSEFLLSAGERVGFVMQWHPSHTEIPEVVDAYDSLKQTESWWREWSDRCTYEGRWREAVLRSLITLKAMTYAPTGGLVAAPTTSLPEHLGGERNWDYRYCWLRDSTMTLHALISHGYIDEACAFRDWLHRAMAGRAEQLQILYGVAGELESVEWEPHWLKGFRNSAPVRIGNAAYTQFQLDIYGEVMDTMHLARKAGLDPEKNAWSMQRRMLDHLADVWQKPDHGMWEVRRDPQHFTFSKVMAWVAMDRGVKAVEDFGLDGPVKNWRRLRDTIHAEVCERAFDTSKNSFMQSYGCDHLDAATLMIPLVGFLPIDDPRVQGTIEAVRRELTVDGLLQRYQVETGVDGLGGSEGAFLLCSFWMADCLALSGNKDEAAELYEYLLSLRNDVGLLSEEYDPCAGHMLGNFPQAFSHIAIVNTARHLHSDKKGGAEERARS